MNFRLFLLETNPFESDPLAIPTGNDYEYALGWNGQFWRKCRIYSYAQVSPERCLKEFEAVVLVKVPSKTFTNSYLRVAEYDERRFRNTPFITRAFTGAFMQPFFWTFSFPSVHQLIAAAKIFKIPLELPTQDELEDIIAGDVD
jgi:hypothetical protein